MEQISYIEAYPNIIFESKKLYSIVSGAEGKPAQSSTAIILAGAIVLDVNGPNCIMNLKKMDTISSTIITNCLDNNIVSHIQSKLAAN